MDRTAHRYRVCRRDGAWRRDGLSTGALFLRRLGTPDPVAPLPLRSHMDVTDHAAPARERGHVVAQPGNGARGGACAVPGRAMAGGHAPFLYASREPGTRGRG